MARTGGAQVFFDVLATFNAKRLLQDTKTVNTMMKAAYLDTLNTLSGEFQALGQMVDEFTDEVIASSRAFEEARIDFEKFVNVSEDMETILPTMVEDIVKIGEGFAFTGEEALKAASRMAQMGAVIGKSTIGVGTEIGVMFGLISGMETDAAMRRLTNLMQQTGFHMAENLEKTEKLTAAEFNLLSAIEKENMFRQNSIEVLNQLNTVENRSIATMDQLTYTMNQFASQASLTGSSIAEMAAMSATLIEAGEQQGAAGRALRMMYARLGGDIAGAREEMQSMGIEIVDSQGDMKTLKDIMVDLKEKGWDELTGIQQQNIAQTVSGNRHYVRFIKLMENLHRVTDLTEQSLFDFDSAQDEVNRRLEENAVVLEKLEAQLENVSAQMGNALLPGMIEGKEITLAWNRELEKFASGNYGEQYANVANSILTFKEVGAILMPFIQLQIAVRGITVAFGTMRSVLAAMLGQQIALNRQYHGATSLMEIQNATTEEQRRLHSTILNIQGEINTKKMFASEIEEQIKLINQINAEVLDKQLLVQLRINDEARKEFIQRQLVATREQQLLDLGSKVEGSMKRRLLIFQNHVEMAERLNRTEQARLRPQDAAGKFVAGTTGLMSPEIARRNLAAGMKDLEMLTKRISRQKDIATASERTLNTLQAQLVTSGKLKTDKEGNWHLTSKELNNQEKLYLKERERMSTAKHRLRDLEKIEYHVKGELMHLDTIIKKQSTYTKMIEEVVADHEKLSALLEKETLDTQEMLVLEEMLSVYLDEEVIKLEKNEESLREQIKLLQSKMLEQKKALSVSRADEVKRQKALEKEVQAHLLIGTAMSRTFSSASMLLPVLGSMTGNTGLMRAGMIAMNLSMVSMLGPLMKGAGETLQMAFSTKKVADATKAAAISSARLKVGFTAAGIAASGILLYALDQAAQRSERLQKSLEKVKSETHEMYGVMESIQTQEFLIANEDLAKIFDVQGIKVRDLANDYNLAKRVQSDFATAVSDSGRFMQRANSELIDDTKTALDMIVSLHESAMGKMERNMFRMQAMTVRTSIMGAKPAWTDELMIAGETLLEAITFSEDAVKRKDMMRFLGFTADNTDSYLLMINSIAEDSVDMSEAIDRAMKLIEEGYRFKEDSLDVIEEMTNVGGLASMMKQYQDLLDLASEDAKTFLGNIGGIGTATQETGEGINVLANDVANLTEEIYNFSGAREELFFGGQYGNVTGSLYRQVVQQGVGTLYHKNEVIMSNNFHGFFNEEEAATRIIDILNDYFAER